MTSPDKSKGLFMVAIDWNNPRFAPWDISKLDMNEAQLDALLDTDDVIDFPELTEEQLKELCLKVPCRVELNHSNVCYGVEKAWPKKMFGKANFKSLNPKEQRNINRDMQRKAVRLNKTYVDEQKSSERRRKRSNRALAPYLEEIFRKNQFLRIKALADPVSGYNAAIDESVIESNAEDLSLLTVINTGKTKSSQQSNNTSKSQKGRTDLNDNDFIGLEGDIGCEVEIVSTQYNRSSERSSMSLHLDDWQSEVISIYEPTNHSETSIQKIDISDLTDDDIDVEREYRSNTEQYIDILSESIVSSSDENQISESPNRSITPHILSGDIVSGTPALTMQRHNPFKDFIPVDDDDVDFDEDQEIDSLDFLSQGVIGLTSTQQNTF